ncbi:hypothetical protein H2O64_14395 [Kordia sp. YSTF-M3]|uniref:Secreted protein n=1 Tax=Kordia aestuariivivens TaxID=2759037 RepID=A0ABR7QBB0_9FLAO|nr:hypothetical protein [Kordia aestuariivivens]MBC8755864.1 hypothetical protein [Kordia aestuariivivens]
MKKVFLTAVFTFLFSVMYTSCTPETLTNEDEPDITVVDPANDGQVDDEPEEEPVQD